MFLNTPGWASFFLICAGQVLVIVKFEGMAVVGVKRKAISQSPGTPTSKAANGGTATATDFVHFL